jgi:hypothetical protein
VEGRAINSVAIAKIRKILFVTNPLDRLDVIEG